MTDISAILTAHREGIFAGPALRSFDAAIARAQAVGLVIERIIMLDNPDPETLAMFADLPTDTYRVVVHSGGEPALSRNHGVSLATGRYVSFLDGDDLWSTNWLVEAHRFCSASATPVVGHSEANIVFGQHRAAWLHVDSAADDFDIDYLKFGNYWDAMCFAARDIFSGYPFQCNDVRNGYGHEDWHWNNVTLAAGIAHRPVPSTVHFKRRRLGSQMSMVNARDVVVLPNEIDLYRESDALSGRTNHQAAAAGALEIAMQPEFFRAVTRFECVPTRYSDEPTHEPAKVSGFGVDLLPPVHDPDMAPASVNFDLVASRKISGFRCIAHAPQAERATDIAAQVEIVDIQSNTRIVCKQVIFYPGDFYKLIEVEFPDIASGTEISLRLSALNLRQCPAYFSGVRLFDFALV